MASNTYRLANLNNLTFGQYIPHNPVTQQEYTTVWQPPTGALTPLEIIISTIPLLSSVLFRVGNNIPSPNHLETLISSLSSSLSTSTRESTLPLPTAPLDASRKELYSQADLIGTTLTRYVRESTIPDTDPAIRIRSPCENHLWSPSTTELLMGPAGGSDVMMLYNEWIHQIILLRDALLPFENFEEVRLVLTAESKGMRGFERARKVFLADIVAGNVPQSALVEAAMTLTASTLITKAKEGYGWQYEHGVVLPASLDIGQENSLLLLRYHPTRVDTGTIELLFEYEYPAYFEVSRSEAASTDQTLQQNIWPPPTLRSTPDAYEASIIVQPCSSNVSRILSLQLSFSKTSPRIDLGQIARGRRFAYYPQSAETGTTTPGLSAPAVVHKPQDILIKSGLVTSSKAALHVIPVLYPIVKLALLGKIYPENVVLVSKKKNDQPAMAEKVGKGFGSRFILWEEYE